MKLPVTKETGRKKGSQGAVPLLGTPRYKCVSTRPSNDSISQITDKELRMLTESVPIRIALVDREQRYRFSNLAHRQSWVGDGAEIIGKTMSEVLGSENYQSARPYVERALAGEEVTFEMTVSYSSTEPRFVRINYLPQYDNEGGISGCLVLALDITEKKLSQEALRQSEARFGRLVEHTPVIPWEADVESQLFTFVGHRCEEILGYPISEWMKPKFRSTHVHEDDRRMVISEFNRAVSEACELELEYRLMHRDGTHVWVRDLVSIIKKSGKVVALQGLMIDVTLSKEADIERRRLEDRLREFQKMQALGTLAGGIAHDFNNILGGIIGYTELALSSSHNRKQSESYLERIKDSSYRARDLVQQILSFSKGRELEKKATVFNSVVAEVLQLLRASIPASINVKLEDKTPNLVVAANTTQIHQVVLNICTNAAHAMKEKGGELKIELFEVPVDEVLSREIPDLSMRPYALLRVTDSGHGMSSEVMTRIFEPYFTTKPTGEGSGLGLAVAHGIITNHGGVISVTSELGKGSCFEVYLPLVAGEVVAEPIATNMMNSLEPEKSYSGRVVFVDDEPSLVEIGRDMLKHIGYEVIGFTSSTEALNYMIEHINEIDLLVTDQTMPDLTGDSLIRSVRKHRKSLPVVICTGYSALIDRAGAEKLGVNAFLSKPYSIVELCSAVKSVLDLKPTS
jgi:PAS domain S-box-containing protein